MATTKQGTKGKAEVEGTETLTENYRDAEAIFERNKKPILIGVSVIVLAVLGFFGYKYMKEQSDKEAQASLYGAVAAWEKDSLKTALNGSKSDVGLLEVSESNSGTDAGNLANYYAGVALLKEGKFQEAIDKLKEFKSSDLLVQGLAYSLTGDAYMELKDYDNAAEYYSKAAEYKPNENFTPQYLMKLALAAELQKDYQKAIDAYAKILNEYPLSRAAADAKKYKARAEGLKESGNVQK